MSGYDVYLISKFSVDSRFKDSDHSKSIGKYTCFIYQICLVCQTLKYFPESGNRKCCHF